MLASFRCTQTRSMMPSQASAICTCSLLCGIVSRTTPASQLAISGVSQVAAALALQLLPRQRGGIGIARTGRISEPRLCATAANSLVHLLWHIGKVLMTVAGKL